MRETFREFLVAVCWLAGPVAWGSELEGEAPAARAGANFGGEISVMWESRYVLEGRDTLDGGGIVSFESAVDAGPLSLGVWHGSGTGGEYGETHLSMGEQVELGSPAVEAGLACL